MKKPFFIKYVVNPVDRFSKWLKYNTAQNSQDWILAILFAIGSYFFLIHKMPDIKVSERLTLFVLWVTFIAIMWYTKETFWLKEVQQKQLDLSRKSIKIKRTLDLIQNFNTSIRLDFEYIMHPKFEFDTKNLNADDYKYIIEHKALPYEKMTPYLSLNNVLSFFEVSGLMAKNNLIDLSVYSDYFRVIVAKLLENKEILKIIKGAVESDVSNWENIFYLKGCIYEK